MMKVMNVIFEADDLVDEAATDVAASKVRYGSICGKGITVGWRMRSKINMICEELDQFPQLPTEISSIPYSESTNNAQHFMNVETSIDLTDVVVWRGLNKDIIVDILLDTSNLNDDISVVAIFGMGGLGKTPVSVVQLVYNDHRVTDHFDLRLWICVSDVFAIREIISSIVIRCSASTKQTIDGLGLDQLTSLLQSALRDKLFLLVLDDVWNEDRGIWLSLKRSLTGGARGSRILVTARSAQVAKTMQAICIELRPPYVESSRSLSKRIAFAQREPTPPLVDQAYNHLPSPLKRCFAYLSLFPKDFIFNILDVVSLWQAQGFLEPAAPELPDEDQQLENLGEEYCLQLARCSLIELDYDTSTFQMHNLIYDMALCVAKEWEKIHVSLVHVRDTKLLQETLKVHGRKLRTFSGRRAPEDAGTMIGLSDIINMSHFKSLRVLDLHAFGIHTLPDSVGNLIHLRYLDLSDNEFLVKLPNSIANLYNLQTLKISDCCDLKELPTSTRSLVCLRRLEIDRCEKLTFMPPGFENLTSLRLLSRYVIGRPHFQSASGFKSLGNLNCLQGRLMIELSENWTTVVHEAAKSNLCNRTRLTELGIKWGPTRRTSKTDRLQHQLLLDNLQPPPSLKMLQIEGYIGHDFPSWARADALVTALPNLITVSIDGCGQCKTLPSFSQLKFLRHLTLRFMGNVQFFENSDNQSPSVSPFFPSLQELTLHSFYSLERWSGEETVSSLSFSRLEKLNIWSCPKLTSMPLFPNVEVLDLQNINKKLLEVSNICMSESELQMSMLPSSSNLEIPEDVPFGLTQNLTELKTLHIKGCPNSKTLALGNYSKLLKKLVLERLEMLCSLTADLKHLTSLEELEIASCKNLDLSGKCQGSCGECNECSLSWKFLSNLSRLTIRDLPKLVTLPVGLSFISTLKVLCISTCNNLSVLPEWMSQITSLQHLILEGCLALTMLPEGLKGLRSLVKVDIIECPKLMERCREGGEDWHKIKHARVLCHKSWRYALMSGAELRQNPKNAGENVVVHSEDPTIHVDVNIRRQSIRKL